MATLLMASAFLWSEAFHLHHPPLEVPGQGQSGAGLAYAGRTHEHDRLELRVTFFPGDGPLMEVLDDLGVAYHFRKPLGAVELGPIVSHHPSQ